MNASRPAWALRHVAVIAALLAISSAGCGEDSTAPPSPGDAANSPAPVLNEHRLTANGKALVGPTGERISIGPERVTGYVDAATPNGRHIDLNGWAAHADLSAPAEAVVAVAGKKSVAITPSIARPDVADGYSKPELEDSGYGISVPLSALDCPAPKQGLEIFAVAEGAATPLEYLGDVGQIIRDACRG